MEAAVVAEQLVQAPRIRVPTLGTDLVDPATDEQAIAKIGRERVSTVLEDGNLNSLGLTLLQGNAVESFNELRSTNLGWKPDLSEGNFEEGQLDGVNLSGVNLCKARFIHASLRNSNLSGANLSGAQVSSANLTGANLQNTNCSDANFSDSTLHGADIRGAKMATAEIDTGYLAEVANRKGRQVKVLDLLRIRRNGSTTLPEVSNPGVQREILYIAGREISAESIII